MPNNLSSIEVMNIFSSPSFHQCWYKSLLYIRLIFAYRESNKGYNIPTHKNVDKFSLIIYDNGMILNRYKSIADIKTK